MLEARSPSPSTSPAGGGGGGRLPSCAEWQQFEPTGVVVKSSTSLISSLLYTQCHPAQKNSLPRQRRRPPPQSDGSAARPPSGKKQPTSSARSVSTPTWISNQKIQHLAANREHVGCRRIQDRQQVARVRPGLRKVRLWYTIYMSMYMYVYTRHVPRGLTDT